MRETFAEERRARLEERLDAAVEVEALTRGAAGALLEAHDEGILRGLGARDQQCPGGFGGFGEFRGFGGPGDAEPGDGTAFQS